MIPVSESGPVPGPSLTAIRPESAPSVTRRRWYRRKRIAIPLVLLLVAALVGGFLGWRVYDSFSTINQVSTPPPVVSGVSLGGDADIAIDTSPALAAVQTYEAAKQEDAAAGGGSNPIDPENGIAAGEIPAEAEPTATLEIATSTDVPVLNELADSVNPTTTATGTSVDPTPSPTIAGAAEETARTPPAAPVLPQPTQSLPAFGEDTLDILLMGVDATSGESIDVGVRPDALAMLHLDRATGACRMLAIPRDTRVELPGYGLSKINHALPVGGVPYEIQVVEQYLGVELDHYGLMDFGGVVKIVDKVGGVQVDNPVAFTSLGIEFPAGVQTLDGDAALAYARFRSDEGGDFGRIGRQQEVLRAVMQKVSPGDLMGMIPEMLPLLQDHFRTDLSPLDLADLARTYGQTCTYDTLETSTLEGSTATYFDPLIELDLSYVIVEDAELTRKREWLLGE